MATILVRYTTTPSATPSAGSYSPGEIAVNANDALVWVKSPGGPMVQLNLAGPPGPPGPTGP